MFDWLPPLPPGFFTGLAFGTVLLCSGLALGLWLGRQERGRRDDRAVGHAAELVGNLWHWARDFAQEVAQYREVIGLFAAKIGELDQQARSPDAESLLNRVIDANERLQQRIDAAEDALRKQADELACYASEARTDALTGLPNRRSFDNEFQRRLAQWRRQKIPFSLVLVDIDRFKQLNDTHGHPAGDAVLSEVGQTLREALEEGEFAARYGGEEFALLLPYDDLVPIADAVLRVSRAVAACEIPFEEKTLRVTLSSGAAAALDGELGPHLVKRADEALYVAKRQGRNRAYWHDGQQCERIDDPAHPTSEPATTAPASDEHPPMPASRLRDTQTPGDFSAVCSDLKERLLELTRR